MATKEQILELARPLLVKILTRVAIYGLTAWFGVQATIADSEGGAIGQGAAAIGCLLLGLVIDRWHHKRDLAEPPK